MSDVDAVVRQLYGLRPEEFTAARDAAAKELSGDDRTRVKGLRKPTQAAWAVNRLVRERPDVVEALAELGDRLREAQAQGDGAALRSLEAERRKASKAALDAAVQVTGLTASSAAMAGVTATLRAVPIDPDSAAAVLTGSVDRPLEASGFGGQVTAAAPRERRSDADRLASARAADERARQALEEARSELDDAEQAHDDAVEASAAATAERERLEAELEVAREAEDDAAARVRSTHKALRSAEEDADAAALAAAAAERDVTALEKATDGA